MGLSSELVSQNLGSSKSFNWPWVIELAVGGILVLFFLFYFNRLFATIVSYLIRLYTWRVFRVWVDVQSIQISLLGGRIFFKGVRYHGENETILVQNGHITWRYWLRDVRLVDLTRTDVQTRIGNGLSKSDSTDDSSGKSQKGDEELGTVSKVDNSQARIAVFVNGVEWFIYNRTPMYDAILKESSQVDACSEAESINSSHKEPIKPTDKVRLPAVLRRRKVPSDILPDGSKHEDDSTTKGSHTTRTGHQSEHIDANSDVTLAQSLLVRMLPVYIVCNRAAVSMGNKNTKALLVTTVDKAKGHIDASGCSEHDMFRQLFDFEIEHPVVQMRPNPDYQSSQMSAAEDRVRERQNISTRRPWWVPRLYLKRRKEKALSQIYSLLPWLYSSTQSLNHHQHSPFLLRPDPISLQKERDGKEWHGLGRYLDENDIDDHQAWSDIEYARYSTVLDCPVVHLNFYWDVPGKVKASDLVDSDDSRNTDINGIDPPAYGLDLIVKGGNINYGPWTDRLRAELQAMFLPASYKSAAPASSLSVGDWRQSTKMLIRVDVDEEVTLRVPMRERSKDWRWRGRATAVRDAAALRKQREKRHFRFRRGQKKGLGPDIRPFGWLSFSVAADSTVRYEMDMVAGASGYRNRLQLDLKKTTASSSVNHALLWECKGQRLDCDLSNPLAWNGSHEWTFDIQNDDMQFFLLRDHMFLLTDLISDFTAGQTSDYMTFVPFKYNLHLQFTDLQLLLNANDFNIIDNACDRDSNAFLILGMQSLKGKVGIPMNHFSPSQNSVHFQACGHDLYLKLTTPLWNTVRNFSQDDTMATLQALDLDGSYNYCTEMSPLLTDTLLMDIKGTEPKFHLQGLLIRYFMNVRENYFGDYLHYKTLEEYQLNMDPDQSLEDRKYQAKKDNDLDVILSIRALDSCVLVPAHVYDRSENLRIDIMNVDMDMRFTNYYMDLQITSSPIEASVEKITDTKEQNGSISNSNCQLYIDHVAVFGHRLFGAPPTEPAYICNWDVDAGNILGECSAEFLRVTIAAVQSLIYTLDDDQNALKPTQQSVLHDMTFLRARTAGLRIWLREQSAAFLLDVAPFDLSFNDQAKDHFSKHLNVFVPKVVLAAVDLGTARRHDDRRNQKVSTIAYVETSIMVATLDKNANFEKNRNLQQHHVWFHDLKTHRAHDLMRVMEPITVTDDTNWSDAPANIPVPGLADRLYEVPPPVAHESSYPAKKSSDSERLPSFNLPRSSPHADTDSHTIKAATAPQPSTGQTVKLIEHLRSERQRDRQSSITPFSSAWMPPYFSLQSLEPASDELPSLTIDESSQDIDDANFRDEDDNHVQDSTFAHGSIMIKLVSGIRGFFSSELSTHVIQLITSIQDHNPVAILDSVERKTIKHIIELTARRIHQISDVAVYIPGLALRLIDCGESSGSGNLACDHYDIRMMQTRIVLRTAPTATKHSLGQTRTDILLAHVSTKTIEFEISEHCTRRSTTAPHMTVALRNLSSWLSLQDRVRSDFQLGNMEVVISGATIDKMSLLFRRTFLMVERISCDVDSLQHSAFEENLIYYLAVHRKDIKDPPFLSRPSDVLRNAEDHVRLSNSWRAIVILRQRMQGMQRSAYNELLRSQTYQGQRSELQQTIVASLNTYTGDIGDMKGYQPLLRSFLDLDRDEMGRSNIIADVQVTSLIGQISLTLDHGPKKSKVAFENCDLSFSQSPILAKEHQLGNGMGQQRAKVTVKSWISSSRIDLNWELVELAKSVFVRMQDHFAVPKEKDQLPVQSGNGVTQSEVDLSIVCGTERASICLTTVNVVISMGAENLKSSLTIIQDAERIFFTMLLASASAYTQITSHATKLLHVQVYSPNVYGAYHQHLTPSVDPGTVQLAATSSRLRLLVAEAPVGLLHVANLILADEVAIIQELASLVKSQSQIIHAENQPDRELPRLRIGLFLEDYRLQLALLPTIQYVISGKVARTSIVPTDRSQFAIHIDLKRNRHTFLRPGSRMSDAISVLEIPPVSGRVILTVTGSVIKLKARSVLEQIEVDASAVQACLEAAFHPENADYLRDVKTALDDCQHTLRHQPSFQKVRQKTQDVRSTKTSILYSTNFVFAGFTVNLTAPIRPEQQETADLKFEIQDVTVNVRNSNKKEVFRVPNFRLSVPSIKLHLFRHLQSRRFDAGKFTMGFQLVGSQELDEHGNQTQSYRALVNGINLDLLTATPAVAVDITAYMQEQLKAMTSNISGPTIQPLRRLTVAHNEMKTKYTTEKARESPHDQHMEPSTLLQNSVFLLEVNAIQARWVIDDDNMPMSPGRTVEDLVFSIRKIDLTTQREDSARLTILDLQVQLAAKNQSDPTKRSRNSALLPEVVFKAAHVSTKQDRRFAFQAAGKALDLKLAADGILPLSAVQKSLTKASIVLRGMPQENDDNTERSQPASISSLLGNKTLSSLLIDADFAGAIFSITPRAESSTYSAFELVKGQQRNRTGRYGKAVRSSDADEAVLRAPGVALKVEYQDTGRNDPSFNMEVKIAASNNTLAPTVVPLVLEIYSSVKEIMGEEDMTGSKLDNKAPAQKYLSDAANHETDPTAVLGRVRLNASLWVQRQEFSLTCQPIARVQATTSFDDIFVTINTVQNEEQDRFVSILTKFNNLQAAVQHVYSRESTASFEVESITMSLMNSKHVSTKNGISAILNISPMSTNINARQLQDFMLFREIWYPKEIRRTSKPATPSPNMTESQTYAMQKYQELTASAALPWHAIVSVQELKLHVDFGQALGRSSFTIANLWASSKKSSNWEQNLCVGFERVGIDSTGRMSGFVELRNFRGRTSIRWPAANASGVRAPLVQGSLGFDHLRLKAAFDYQPFAVADVSSFEFLMYNVRPDRQQETDRLVGILNGGKVQAFCISAAGGQVLAIIQAFERLFQEKRDAYQDSLHEVERLLRRKSVFPGDTHLSVSTELVAKSQQTSQTIHTLHTDVVVTLNAVDIGAFPNTFFDNQILKIQAADAQARFAVATVDSKVRSGLSMSLGQVRLALSSVGRSNTKALGEVEIADVVDRATSSRGGTIIKVPRLVASMQTWQEEQSNLIEYIFRSTFQGKVDVGWNYSRISFIRGMWDTHSQAMAQRLGKPLPPSAVKITAEDADENSGQEKITAVVNMPQSSKYEYVALEPPVVDTPQLRDMGEATPPLEWIGLHRDKLPNVTHSIIIVTLLEVAREVEDAYTRILGTG